MLTRALAGRGGGGGKIVLMMPGLRSLRATTRVHVLLCVVLVVLLMALYVQISNLEYESSLVLEEDEDEDEEQHGTHWSGKNPEFRVIKMYDVPLHVTKIPLEQRSAHQSQLKAVDQNKHAAPPAAGDQAAQTHQSQLKAVDQNKHAVPPAAGDQAAQKNAKPPQASAKLPTDSQLAEKKKQAAESKRDDSLAMSDTEIAALSQVLEQRIREAGRGYGIIGTRNCTMLAAMNNTRGTCIDRSCPHKFHASAEHRIRELLLPYMRPTAESRKVVSDIAYTIRKKRYIFATTASSNHYNESQALVYSLSKNVFPKLQPDSYDFYYFDLGLKAAERRRVEKNCGCIVKSFPVSALPPFSRHLMCYAWKPVIIKALLEKAEIVVYMDSSIRFQPETNLNALFESARRWGAQFLASLDTIPNHTVNYTFQYYGDPPCLYWPYPELLAGFSVFRNEPFMNRIVLDPWLACAFNATCMCPVHPHAFRICPHLERRIGQCHRFDLSSLTLQMAKLYGDTFGHLVIRDKYKPKVVRNDRMGYFKD